MANDIQLFGNMGLIELIFTAVCAYVTFATNIFVHERTLAWVVVGLVAISLFSGVLAGSNPADGIADVTLDVISEGKSIIFPAVILFCMYNIIRNQKGREAVDYKNSRGQYTSLPKNKLWWGIAAAASLATALKSNDLF